MKAKITLLCQLFLLATIVLPTTLHADDAVTATFEEMTLSEESHWFGDEPEVEYVGTLTGWNSGSYKFYAIKYMETWWSGYSCTNETATTFSSLNDSFRSAAGGAHNGSNYSVAYPSDYYYGDLKIEVTNNENGDVIRGFYITNNSYAYSSMMEGDYYSSKFTTGDYFIVTIKGYNGDTVTDSIAYYLADYRSTNEADHYCLNTWQWVDLRALGTVTSVGFSFSGSQNNSYGLVTPTYFAMDDFNGEREITDKPTLTSTVGTKTYALADYFTLDADGSTVTYAVETETASDGVNVSVDENGQLVVEGITNLSTASVIISATQKGKIQFVRLPISIDNTSGINDVAVSSGVSIYPVPVTDRLNVATALTDYTVELFSTSGTCVLAQEGNNGNISIDCDGINSGVYFVRVSNAETAVVKRIIVK